MARVLSNQRSAISKQQSANSKQQSANSNQQTAISKQQSANSNQQTANSKQQTANSNQQSANSKQQTAISDYKKQETGKQDASERVEESKKMNGKPRGKIPARMERFGDLVLIGVPPRLRGSVVGFFGGVSQSEPLSDSRSSLHVCF